MCFKEKPENAPQIWLANTGSLKPERPGNSLRFAPQHLNSEEVFKMLVILHGLDEFIVWALETLYNYTAFWT